MILLYKVSMPCMARPPVVFRGRMITLAGLVGLLVSCGPKFKEREVTETNGKQILAEASEQGVLTPEEIRLLRNFIETPGARAGSFTVAAAIEAQKRNEEGAASGAAFAAVQKEMQRILDVQVAWFHPSEHLIDLSVENRSERDVAAFEGHVVFHFDGSWTALGPESLLAPNGKLSRFSYTHTGGKAAPRTIQRIRVSLLLENIWFPPGGPFGLTQLKSKKIWTEWQPLKISFADGSRIAAPGA